MPASMICMGGKALKPNPIAVNTNERMINVLTICLFEGNQFVIRV